MNARITQFGDTVFADSPTDFAKHVAEFTEKWGNVIRAATSDSSRSHPPSTAVSRCLYASCASFRDRARPVRSCMRVVIDLRRDGPRSGHRCASAGRFERVADAFVLAHRAT